MAALISLDSHEFRNRHTLHGPTSHRPSTGLGDMRRHFAVDACWFLGLRFFTIDNRLGRSHDHLMVTAFRGTRFPFAVHDVAAGQAMIHTGIVSFHDYSFHLISNGNK
jgi:hypothetical protein